MSRRRQVSVGVAAAALWTLGLIAAPEVLPLPALAAADALPLAFLGPGVALVAMIGTLGNRRFGSDEHIDGARFAPGTPGEIDQRVLSNTVEQSALAILAWPIVAMAQGGAAVVLMGASFLLARLAFWFGYHISPPFRAFGFGATFYPTVLATLWALATLAA